MGDGKLYFVMIFFPDQVGDNPPFGSLLSGVMSPSLTGGAAGFDQDKIHLPLLFDYGVSWKKYRKKGL
jgi:hypothetical protein